MQQRACVERRPWKEESTVICAIQEKFHPKLRKRECVCANSGSLFLNPSLYGVSCYCYLEGELGISKKDEKYSYVLSELHTQGSSTMRDVGVLHLPTIVDSILFRQLWPLYLSLPLPLKLTYLISYYEHHVRLWVMLEKRKQNIVLVVWCNQSAFRKKTCIIANSARATANHCLRNWNGDLI